MKKPSLVYAIVLTCLAAGMLTIKPGRAADPVKATPPERFVVHEWGTFTSFSGSNGVPVGFRPDNSDLPEFVYSDGDERNTKSLRLERDGTVSMETPVVYFYTDREMRASVKVGFPRGWITEWFPAANQRSTLSRQQRAPGQTILWDVKLLAGDNVRLPGGDMKKHYFHARDTDAVAVQVEPDGPAAQRIAQADGATVVQREKFLFYRGVGTFPTPASVRPLGSNKVRVANTTGDVLGGLVLVTVRDGKVGFRPVDVLEPGAESVATLPNVDGTAADVFRLVTKNLTAAGLYEKEAVAMVRTWESAWFGENGTRLLYLVPRTRTDELLPMTITPKPTEVVRVLVGRHDFLTPEQEAETDRQMRRARSARADLDAAEAYLKKIGRFQPEAMREAEKRLDAESARR